MVKNQTITIPTEKKAVRRNTMMEQRRAVKNQTITIPTGKKAVRQDTMIKVKIEIAMQGVLVLVCSYHPHKTITTEKVMQVVLVPLSSP